MYKLSFFLIFSVRLIFAQYAEADFLMLNGEKASMEQLLQEYIRIPSVSGNEKAAGDFIKSVCRENGLHIASFGESNGNYNFAASVFPLESGKPNIIFLNHIDVVPESDQNKFEAFSGKLYEGNIYGRGAIDNKGMAVMQLTSIIHLLKNQQIKNSKFNVTFLSVSCEETQCSGGIEYVLDNYFDLLNPAVVIGEGPTEISTLMDGEFKNPIFAVSVAHKRTFWLHLERDIKSIGHGSITPINYANKEMVAALSRLVSEKPKARFNEVNVRILKSLAEHKKGIEKLVLKHPKFFKPLLVPQLRKEPKLFSVFSNTVTLTNINSHNDAYNMVPEKVEAFLDCRLLPDEDENAFLKKIRKKLKNDSIRIKVVKSMPRTTPSDIRNIYYHNLEKAIQLNYPNSSVIPIMMPNLNDLGAFRARGITAFATMPVYVKLEHVDGIHNSNEKIPVNALYEGSQVYYNFLSFMMEEPDDTP